MKTRIQPPSTDEIETRRRLRLFTEHLGRLNSQLETKLTLPADLQEPNHLEEFVVNSIRRYMSENGVDTTDLMSIRQAPHKFFNATQWAWILHRFQNRYLASGQDTRKDALK